VRQLRRAGCSGSRQLWLKPAYFPLLAASFGPRRDCHADRGPETAVIPEVIPGDRARTSPTRRRCRCWSEWPLEADGHYYRPWRGHCDGRHLPTLLAELPQNTIPSACLIDGVDVGGLDHILVGGIVS